MGYPVDSKRILQLPTFDTPMLLVNGGDVSGSGGDVIYLGTQRDNLNPLGYPLSPLASLSINPGQSYYAVANSSVQNLELLPGGAGFSPSPQQIVSILNVAPLATAIGSAVPQAGTIGAAVGGAVPQPGAIATAQTNSGARLVDPAANQTLNTGNVALGATTAKFDMSGAVSFFLRLDPTSTAIQTTMEVNLLWYDGAGTILTSRVYEYNTAGGCIIQDRCLGSQMAISNHAVYGAGAPGNLKYSLYGSSRPVDTNRILGEGGDSGSSFGFDGTLLFGSGTLAFGASATRLYGAVANGRAFIHVAVGTGSTGGPLRFRFWHGLNTAQTLNYNIDLAVGGINVTDPLQEIILPPRPLICDITNLGASGSMIYGMHVWTDPNSHS